MIGYLFGLIRVITDSFLITSRKKLRNYFAASKLLYLQSILSLVLGVIAYSLFQPEVSTIMIFFVFLTVLFVSIGNFLEIYAWKFDDFSKLGPIFGISVIYTLILGIIILREIPTTLQFVGILITLIGVYLLGNEGKWRYPLKMFKNKAVILFLIASFWSSLSLAMMKKSLEFASLRDVTVFNLLFGLPIVYSIYRIFNKEKGKQKSLWNKHVWWFFILLLSEPSTLILNVVTVSFIPIVHARIIFSLSILLVLVFGKIFFNEKVKYRIIPTSLIFIGVIVIILNSV